MSYDCFAACKVKPFSILTLNVMVLDIAYTCGLVASYKNNLVIVTFSKNVIIV
jgi:hypothetical protein